ncbi:MAG TPA: protein kinase, partial [Polyangiaceae bacterium]
MPGYRIERELGRGGFGVVYRAERVADARSAAIKVALPDQAGGTERLVREGDALEEIGPPFVPAVYQRGACAGRYYLAMEFISLPSLADLLVDQVGPMAPAAFRTHAFPILDPVEAIHRAHLVHRDLKPENILVAPGIAKVIDFGLVKKVTDRHAEHTMGTAEYMAPEQCEAGAQVDIRADLYALGVIFYEMISGAPPFFGTSAEVQESHRSRRPTRLSNRVAVSSDLDEVIMRCLAKEARKRYDSVDALRTAMMRALVINRRSTSSSPPRPSAAPEPATPNRPEPEKRAVGLVFLESTAGIAAMRPTLAELGGELAQATGTRYVAVFGHEVGDNPARRAIFAAQGLVDRKLCTRALVDVSQVVIQTRPDGTRRFMSPLFTRKDRFLKATDPAGALLTEAAVQTLPDLPVNAVRDYEGLFKLDPNPGPKELTAIRMASGGFVGRDDLVHEIVADATRALADSQPAITTIVSEPGYGKSHLAGVVVEQLEMLPGDNEVMFVAAHEAIGGVVDQTFREMLQRALELGNDPPSDLGRQAIADRLGDSMAAQVWAAVALVLGWISLGHPQIRAFGAAPGALRSAAARALGEALRIRARARPLAIVFDDAHLADAATLDALEYAALEEGGAAIWIGAFARPDLERGRPAWSNRAARSARYELGPLDADSAATLARRLLAPAENVSKQTLARLFERTQGVPRLLVELVRGFKRHGIVRAIERGTSYYLATEELEKLPEIPIVQWSASRELESLSPELAAHARFASVLGSKFTDEDMERVLAILEREHHIGDATLDATVGTERLIEAGLFVRHRTGQIDFRHALLQDTIYRSFPEGLRTAVHCAAYEMYENAGDLPERERLPRLAFHASRAGFADRAASLYLELAEIAQQAHVYLDAELMYDAVLANLPAGQDERISQAIKGRALMRFRVGRWDDALRDLAAARERAHRKKSIETETDILLDEAEVLDWIGDIGRSASLVEEAALLARDARADLVRARLTMARGRIHHRLGRPQQSVDFLKEAVALAEPLGEAAYETLVISLVLLGPNYVALGRLDEAEQMMTRAVQVSQQHGDYHHLAAALNNRISIWLSRRQMDLAIRDLERVLEISREAGFPQIEFHTHYNLGECLFFRGEIDAALKHCERAIEICE